MADVPTASDLFASGRREALTLPTRFDPAIIDTVGSDVNVVFAVASAMGEDLAVYFLAAFSELFLSTASGEALDRWVYDRYQLIRFRAQSAVATLSLTRSDTSVGVTIPAGSTFSTATGVVFETVIDTAFAAGVAGPIGVSAVAQLTGQSGNVAAGTISVVTASLPVQDVVSTNTLPAAGGREAETDDELRDRARSFFVNARRGTLSAIRSGALSVPRVAQATPVEVLNESDAEPFFRVTLNIADSLGQANTELATDVDNALLEFRALGVPVTIIPAVPQFVNIVASGLLFEAGANTADVLNRARSAVLSVVNNTQPGELLRRADVLAALTTTQQLIVPEGALTEPLGDLTPTTGTVIRTTADRIQLNP